MTKSATGWSKAPDFTGDPERRAAVAQATSADKEFYLTGGLREIECRACHACVQVKKYSPFHTSVQWNVEARSRCLELDGAENPAMVPTCSRLSASIDHGVAEGIIDKEYDHSDPANPAR
jgi:hypothetical protein